MNMEKRKVNAGILVEAILGVSLACAALITDWQAGGVSIFLDMLFWSAVIFAALFFVSAVIIGIFNIPLKETPASGTTSHVTSPRHRRRRRKRKATIDEIEYYDAQYDEWYERWQEEQEKERKKRNNETSKWIPF